MIRVISECAEGAHAECPRHCPRGSHCCKCECECHKIYRPEHPRLGRNMNPYTIGAE